MANVVVVGAQWGDEGKGRVVDELAARAAVVVRFQGGANAGHTVFRGGQRVVLHLLPSGILRPDPLCVIGNGVVVDPVALLEEIETVRGLGVEVDARRLRVSGGAHVVLPWHKLLDSWRERARGAGAIGTTGRGIGPAYEAKIGRRGLRFHDFVRPEAFRRHLEETLPVVAREAESWGARIGERAPEWSAESIAAELGPLAASLKPLVCDPAPLIVEASSDGRPVLFEGAQGTLLDVDHGTYPFVTSSSCVAAAAATGSGVGPGLLHRVVGVTKGYATRVGAGPFPTELHDGVGERLRHAGQEFGATTGRARRCGWLDAVALKHAARLNGADFLVVTKLDVLAGLPALRVAVGYRIGGRVTEEFPQGLDELEAASPVYQELPGWSDDLGACARYEDLPAPVRGFVVWLERRIEVPVAAVSVGQMRDQVLWRRDPFE